MKIWNKPISPRLWGSPILLGGALWLLTMWVPACTSVESAPKANREYIDSLDRWHQQRVSALKRDDGWLKLAGLFFLQEGISTFGGDLMDSLQFPCEPQLGYLEVGGGKVRMYPAVSGFTLDGTPADEPVFIYDQTMEKSPLIAWGNLRFTILERSGLLALRLWDLESPMAKLSFEIPRYLPDTTWVIRAKVEKAPALAMMETEDVLGLARSQPLYGYVSFQLDNFTYKLQVSESGNSLFIMFTDLTTGEETYEIGRYLYAPLPDAQGYTQLDFNKAINPPCAFTPYATCLLPPAKNYINWEIRAGEKNFTLYLQSFD
jgi:uncharacterized protein (DUF1684 family)